MESGEVLTTFDFSDLDKIHPLIKAGFTLLLARSIKADVNGSQVQFELRVYKKAEFKITLTERDNIFSFFFVDVNNDEFNRLKADFNLTLPYSDFLQLFRGEFRWLAKITENKCVLRRQDSLGHKYFDIFELELQREEEQWVNDLVESQYQRLGVQVRRMQARIKDVMQVIKVKNPYLITQLNNLKN